MGSLNARQKEEEGVHGVHSMRAKIEEGLHGVHRQLRRNEHPMRATAAAKTRFRWDIYGAVTNSSICGGVASLSEDTSASLVTQG
jgi:hypothetical protein